MTIASARGERLVVGDRAVRPRREPRAPRAAGSASTTQDLVHAVHAAQQLGVHAAHAAGADDRDPHRSVLPDDVAQRRASRPRAASDGGSHDESCSTMSQPAKPMSSSAATTPGRSSTPFPSSVKIRSRTAATKPSTSPARSRARTAGIHVLGVDVA